MLLLSNLVNQKITLVLFIFYVELSFTNERDKGFPKHHELA